MKMLKTLAVTILTPTLIEAAKDSYHWVCSCFDDTPPKKHKLVDTHKFDKTDIEIIKERHSAYLRGETRFKTTKDLGEALNRILGLNKSLTSYSRIWNNKV